MNGYFPILFQKIERGWNDHKPETDRQGVENTGNMDERCVARMPEAQSLESGLKTVKEVESQRAECE